MVDYGLLEGSKSFRRLGSDDYKALLHWFRMKVIPATEGTPSYEFLDPGDWASFNKALTLATEGRVLFQTLDGSFGLGPGSMSLDDEIRAMPGERTHIVLRRYHGQDVKIPDWAERRTFTVVGSCYLDCHNERDEFTDEDQYRGNFDSGLQGSLPRELLSLDVFSENKDIVRQVKGERVYLV